MLPPHNSSRDSEFSLVSFSLNFLIEFSFNATQRREQIIFFIKTSAANVERSLFSSISFRLRAKVLWKKTAGVQSCEFDIYKFWGALLFGLFTYNIQYTGFLFCFLYYSFHENSSLATKSHRPNFFMSLSCTRRKFFSKNK